MTEAISWPAVVSAVLLALIAGLPGMIGAWRVEKRSNSQDHQLNKIEQATNGGVKAMRDTIATLENKAIIDTAEIADLKALVKRLVADNAGPA